MLEKLRYCNRQRFKCVDLKTINFLLGEQCCCTKYPYLIWLWDSRARNELWIGKKLPERIKLAVNESKATNKPFVPRKKKILSPVHFKLRIISST